MECENCRGVTDTTMEMNPDPAVRIPVRQSGNHWLIPQRLNPSDVFIDELAGFDLIDPEVLEPGCHYRLEFYDNQVEDPNNPGEFLRQCGLRLCEPECTTVVEWSSGEAEAPADPEFPDRADGWIAVDLVDPDNPCKTHDFVCDPAGGGRWIPLCATSFAGATTTVDEVCYDTAGWAFPQPYSQGAGEWIVFNNDQMEGQVCSDERITSCPATVESDGDAWGDFGGADGPDAGWNSLPFAAAPVAPQENATQIDGCSTSISVIGGGYRATFRMNFGMASGSAGPINLRFNHFDVSGSIAVAMYDIISGDQLPVTIIAQPAGNPLTVKTNDFGEFVQGSFAGSGPGAVELSFDLPAGVDAANVRALWWNVGATDGEQFNGIELDYTATTAATGCFTWSSIVALAAWLNDNDPNGPGWIIQGDRLCRQVPAGAGIAYGNLAGQNNGNGPDITQISVGGTISTTLTTFTDLCTLLQTAPAGTAQPGATQLFLNPDGSCVKVDQCIASWPTVVPYADGPGGAADTADNFILGTHITEVCVSGANTGQIERWTIERDLEGEWQWRR